MSLSSVAPRLFSSDLGEVARTSVWSLSAGSSLRTAATSPGKAERPSCRSPENAPLGERIRHLHGLGSSFRDHFVDLLGKLSRRRQF